MLPSPRILAIVCLSFFPAATVSADGSGEVPRTTPLTKAIRMEQFEVARSLVTPELANKADAGKYHPLTYAAFTRHTSLMEDLIKAGADVNRIEHNGKTALFICAETGNTKGVHLLIKHGAKYPDKDNAYQPAYAAVKAHSSEVLELLFKAYGEIDLSAGWVTPTERAIREEGCAINYAAIHGLNEIGLLLLKHNCPLNVALWEGDNRDRTSIDMRGKKALHLAAENSDCTLEFFQALLKAGCDPLESTPNHHMQRSTPMDYAVAAGSLEKVKILMRECDLNNRDHRAALERSYFIASAWNKKEVWSYLQKELNITPKSPKQWLEEYGEKDDADEGHTEVVMNHLIDALPVADVDFNRKINEGSIAVISARALINGADLLAAELSKVEGVTVLERDGIDLVLQEAAIKSFSESEHKVFANKLKLIPAEYLILLDKKVSKEGTFIDTAVISTNNGMVVTRYAVRPDYLNNQVYVSKLLNVILGKIAVSNASRESTLVITLSEIKPERPDDTSLALARSVNTMLPYYVTYTAGCTNVARTQLEYLETEKAIGAQDGYWKAAWVINGSIVTDTSGKYSLTLFAVSTVNNQKVVVKKSLELGEAYEAFSQTWNELAEKIKLPATTAVDSKLLKDEAALLSENAEWYLKTGYYKEGFEAIKAAKALGAESFYVHETLIKGRIFSFPYTTAKVCHHTGFDPRNMEISKRYEMVGMLDQYIEMLDYTEDYINYRGRNSSNPATRNMTTDKFYPLIARVMREIAFLRTVTDDVIIQHYHAEKLSIIDEKFRFLVKIYGHTAYAGLSNWEKIGRQLNDDKHLYLPRVLPNLEQELFQEIRADLLKGKYESGGMDGCIYKKMFQYKLVNMPIDQWNELVLEIIEKNDQKASSEIFSIASYYAKNPYLKREFADEALARVIKAYPKNIRINTMGMIEWNNCLIGTEYKKDPGGVTGRYLITALPPGTHSSILDVDPMQLKGTAELRRNWGVYLWALRFKEFTDTGWGYLLDTYVECMPTLSENQKFTKEDLIAFKNIYIANNMNSEQVLKKFDDLITPRDKLAASSLLLKDGIITPLELENKELGAHLDHESGIIVGDDLWMPVSYMARENLDPMLSKNFHAIQVTNLISREVHLIHIPKGLDGESGKLGTLIEGDKYVYYSARRLNSTGHRLFAITKKQHEFTEIKLPMDYILAVSDNAIGDHIYVSVSDAPHYENVGKALNQVLLINGTRIENVVISDQRKPAQSPLDEPLIQVTRIRYRSDHVSFHSMVGRGTIEDEDRSLAIYKFKEDKWKLIPKTAIIYVSEELNKEDKKVSREFCKIETRFGPAYLVNLFHCAFRSFSISLEDMPQARGKMPKLESTSGKYTKILVSAEMVNHPIFEVPITPYSTLRYADESTPVTVNRVPYGKKAWWFTPNKIMAKGYYQVVYIGTWKDKVLLGMKSESRGLPAIWVVDKKDVSQAIEQSVQENLDKR